jgi:alkylation response protein AidB-like acyl-CoA dehydrogenase
MDLSLNETQQLLKQGVEDFLARDATREAILEVEHTAEGYSTDMWRTAAEIGWTGMVTPEAYGGSGASLTDVAVVFEGLGRGPVPGPFFSSGVLSPLVLLEAATEEQRQRWLPALASGDAICTLAVTEPQWSWDLEQVRLAAEPALGGGYRLTGVKLFVYDAHVADHLIVAARAADGLVLLMVDAHAPGVSTRRLSGFNTSECEVRFEGVTVPADAVLGGPSGVGRGVEALQRALVRATPVLCAYMVGGAQAVYERSVEYSRERRQFNQPIGRFQHVQNHIVQLVNYVDAARWTTYEALWKLDAGRERPDIAMHLAKACASEGYVQATNYAHEVHAGIGVMREYGLTLHTRTSRSLYHALGDPRWHRRRLGDLLPDYALGEVAVGV